MVSDYIILGFPILLEFGCECYREGDMAEWRDLKCWSYEDVDMSCDLEVSCLGSISFPHKKLPIIYLKKMVSGYKILTIYIIFLSKN